MQRLLQQWENLTYELSARIARILPSIQYDVPYVCQFAVPASAESSLKKELEPVDDTAWKETGAISPERYAQWAFTMCGMASTAMALGYFKDKKEKPAELAEDALQHGVYLEDAHGISDMRYKQFSKWIEKHGLKARVYSRLSLRGVQYALSNGRLVVISVNPNIRGYETASRTQKGGHLVLATGYDLEKGTVSINNPSGFESMDTQLKHVLPVSEFQKYFAGRGIVIEAA
jgi:Peptidase_C39 like family